MAPTCKRQIVSCNQRGQLMLPVQAGDQFKNHFAGAAIEIAGRFVSQQDLRLSDQGAGKASRCCSPPESSPER